MFDTFTPRRFQSCQWRCTGFQRLDTNTIKGCYYLKTYSGGSLRAASNDVLADGSRLAVLDGGFEDVSAIILDPSFGRD